MPSLPSNFVVFTGNANPELAQRVVKHLDISLGNASVSKFSDGEVAIEISLSISWYIQIDRPH